jgi:gliding motility-associated-like protein
MNTTLYLGNDTTICMNHKLLLNAAIPWGVNYQWENGSTNATRWIENEGEYWVQASNPCISVSDTIFIKVDDCDPLLIMPNVFTPNSDGTNDVFKAGSMRNINSLNILIFNRWGENIFQSSNLNFAWDGQIENHKCPEGVYFWVIQYVDNNGNKHDLNGTVTLLR